MTRRFFLENLGCAKNQVDAEIMIAALLRAGWEQTAEPDGADTILVNTCGFIQSAKEESINVSLEYLNALPDSRVIMTGCLSQRYPHELLEEIPELAGVFGNRAPARIVDFLEQLEAGGDRVMVPSGGLESYDRTHLLSFPGSAFVKVAEGCDNRCSFCAIPLIRGAMRSKPVADVVSEIAALVERGIREINLVAQDLASYGRDLVAPRGRADATGPGRPAGSASHRREPAADPAVELLQRISDLDGEFWVRLLYVYPERFPHSFFPILRSDPRLLPYFDIPFQHASREVLRRMGRPGGRERYLDLIRTIRNELPHAIIRSTLLVGFFGETPEAFEELLAFQEEAQLDWLGVFPYSPEDGTPAMRGDPALDVPPEEAARRAAVVEERQRSITHARMDRLVGQDLDVLVEEMVPDEPLAIGRCYAQAPEVDGSVVINVPDGPVAAGAPGRPARRGAGGDRSVTAGRGESPHQGSAATAATTTPAGEPPHPGAAATGAASGPRVELRPGELIRCRIVRRNGLDVEAVPL